MNVSFQCLDIKLIYDDNMYQYVCFGRNLSGKSVCLRVHGFKDYFYVKNTTEIKHSNLIEILQNSVKRKIDYKNNNNFFN